MIDPYDGLDDNDIFGWGLPTSIPIRDGRRTLRANWTAESQQDLVATHNILDIISEDIVREIDEEITRDIIATCRFVDGTI